MGCCLSTTRSHPDHKTRSSHQKFPAKSPISDPDLTRVRDHRTPPPPPPVEEEFVKEVMSETPVVSKRQNTIPAEEEKETQMPTETKDLSLIHTAEKEVSELSQISESFSLSTTTTTTITEKKEEEDEAMSKRSSEVSQSALHRVQSRGARKRPYTAELNGRRVIPAKGSSEVRTRMLKAGTTGVRKDPGEDSGRRSRSPARRRASGVGRTPGKATGRAGGGSLDSGVQSKQSSGGEEELNDGILQQGNESLENPLVSLECFIFL